MTPGTTRRGLALLAGACWLALAGPGAAQEIEDPGVRVGLSINDSTFLPIYLAEEEGYFADEGLEVEITVFRGGSDLTRALVADAVDIAVAAPTSVLAAINADQAVKVFFGGFNQTPFDWYAVPEVTSIEDAEGHRFGITRYGSSTDALTRYALTAAGLDPDVDVKIVQGGGSVERITAMETGQIDAAILAAPFSYVAEDEGYNRILRQSDVMPDFPIQSLYAAEDYIESHPETIKAVLRAVIRGIKLAKGDRERAVETLMARTELAREHAERAYEDLRDGWREDGRLASEEGMAAFWDMAVAVGDVGEPWPLERFWDDRFVSTIEEWAGN